MTNTEELQKSCLGAIRSFELAYPSFKPEEDLIEFWSETLMELKLEPEDIKGGVKLFIKTETSNFNVNLPTLISYCKRVRSVRIRKSDQEFRALEDKSKNNIFNGQGKTDYIKEMIEVTKELGLGSKDFWDKPDLDKLEVFNKKILEINEKHGKSTPEED